jgi:hypothetical protein
LFGVKKKKKKSDTPGTPLGNWIFTNVLQQGCQRNENDSNIVI